MVHASTDEKTIENLSISPESVSFDIDTGGLQKGGGSRKIRFIASRKGDSSDIYQASATALWLGILDETKTIQYRLEASALNRYSLSNSKQMIYLS